ncbi:MAG: class I SAM-dependent methyltransferase [Myxococcota bacterium]
MRWDQLDPGLRARLLQWHAPIWEPLIRKGLDASGDLAGKRVLEVGCGDGGLACLLASCGAQVFATDLSQARLRAGRALSEQMGLASRVHFFRGNARELPLGRGRFDLVLTRSVLVLLDRRLVVPRLAPLLVPETGAAVFIENMENHPGLRLWRRITRTKWGSYPYLSNAEVARFADSFERVDASYSGLLLPVVGPFGRLQRTLAPLVGGIDAALLALFPRLARYAWLVVLRCTGPKRPRDAER